VLAQVPDLPRPSPDARVQQRVGLTDIIVTYSSPGVKGRPIWGALVPNGELWRTGANAPTRITFSRDVTFGGKPVPAGTYSLFTIPTDTNWKVVLNHDPHLAGVFDYKKNQDVARVNVAAQESPPRERLTFLFEDTTDNSTRLVMDWAKKRFAVDIEVDTKAHVKANIDGALKNAWRPIFNSGRYVLDTDQDAERALALFQQANAIQETWWSQWWSAQALHKLNRHGPARQSAQKAASLGKGDATYERAFATQVSEALKTWPKE
jgi:hypothetical protein